MLAWSLQTFSCFLASPTSSSTFWFKHVPLWFMWPPGGSIEQRKEHTWCWEACISEHTSCDSASCSCRSQTWSGLWERVRVRSAFEDLFLFLSDDVIVAFPTHWNPTDPNNAGGVELCLPRVSDAWIMSQTCSSLLSHCHKSWYTLLDRSQCEGV